MRAHRRSTPVAGVLILVLLAPRVLEASAPLLELRSSPDTAIEISGALARDHELSADDFVALPTTILLPGLSRSADVVAADYLANDDYLLAFESALELPASPSNILARPGDVVRYSGGNYSLELDASAAGLPRGVLVDAVSADGSDLVLSFDVAVDLGGGVVVRDEDLVRWNGSTFSLYLDLSSHGAAASLDLDGVHLVEPTGLLLLSFDTSGQVGGVDFRDEDLLELDPNGSTWTLARDASQQAAGWRAGDLDAVSAMPDSDADGLWDDDELAIGTDPLDPDTDGDGLADGVETGTGVYGGPDDQGTDPLDPDTDRDTARDGYEVARGTDPLDPSSRPPAEVPAMPPAGRVLLFVSLLLVAALRLTRLTREGSPS